MFVLIAGDNFPSNFVDHIRGWGHEVEIASTGHDALMRTEGKPFDLIVLDVLLPDISGQLLIPRIKSVRPEAPIVTITARNSSQLEKEIRSLGVCCYLTKPFPLEELKSILDHIQGVLLKRNPAGVSPAAGDPLRGDLRA